MDFFGQQDRAKANTLKLVLLFCLAVVSIVLGIFVVISLWAEGASEMQSLAWTPKLAIEVSLVVGTIVGISSLLRIGQL